MLPVGSLIGFVVASINAGKLLGLPVGTCELFCVPSKIVAVAVAEPYGISE